MGTFYGSPPPTIFIQPQPPPFPAPPRTVDLSPLEFILALLAFITIPALIYAFFFAVKCPPWPFRRRDFRQRSGRFSTSADDNSVIKTTEPENFSAVKYQKETHVRDIGSDCPVCLSVFADGEDIKQLSECKHSFHASCIDMWLKSHSNCPICRASVPANKRPTTTAPPRRDREDLQQGLPDAASLV